MIISTPLIIQIIDQQNIEKLGIPQFLKSSIFEASAEKKSNELLRKYGISKICSFKTNSFYSQFKTRINGETLDFYAKNVMYDEKENRCDIVDGDVSEQQDDEPTASLSHRLYI